MPPNGLTHQPLTPTRQEIPKTIYSIKWPLRTRAEGGQGEPMLGGD